MSRSYDLPADVFEPGEVKPTRPKKMVKKTESSVKKRSFETSELEVSLAPMYPENLSATGSWTNFKLGLAIAAGCGQQTRDVANLICFVCSCRNPHSHKTVQNDSILLISFRCSRVEEKVSTSSATGTSFERSRAWTVLNLTSRLL